MGVSNIYPDPSRILKQPTAPPSPILYDLWLDTDETSQSSPPTLLNLTTYDPGSFTTKTATSSIVNLDTTNLAPTITVPASGNLLVRLSALVNPESGANYYWYIRNGSDTVLAKSIVTAGAGDFVLQSIPFKITGQTPGASLQLRWAHSQATGASTTNYGDTGGGIPATIEVWSA